MADTMSTRLHIEPPIDQWRAKPRNGRTKPIIATGHQPTLWHPGILAKYLTADAFAKRVGGSTLNVVVDHNPVEPIGIDLPISRDQALQAVRLALDDRPTAGTIPPNRLPALRAVDAVKQLTEQARATGVPKHVQVGLHRLAQAYQSAGTHEHLAAQTSSVLNKLMQPDLHQPMQALPTSELVTHRFVQRLLQDPVGCARSYNRAAQAYPKAGIRRLYVGRDVVEVPLWAQGEGACTPVFIDLGDTAKPLLFTQGQVLDLTGTDVLQVLRPRAITLSAIMRSELCDLFIHGTGGGVYDQVTEHWWQDWAKEDLAPMAVVSADVVMSFEVPTATRDEYAKAQWYAHHLRHNVDRYTQPMGDDEAALRQEKHELLERMDDDRLKRRRAVAFRRIHAINKKLGALHRDALAQAKQRADDARIGLGNNVIVRRRDWCFALYPECVLQGLADKITAGLAASPG